MQTFINSFKVLDDLKSFILDGLTYDLQVVIIDGRIVHRDYGGYHEMPQKACERGFFHVIAFS